MGFGSLPTFFGSLRCRIFLLFCEHSCGMVRVLTSFEETEHVAGKSNLGRSFRSEVARKSIFVLLRLIWDVKTVDEMLTTRYSCLSLRIIQRIGRTCVRVKAGRYVSQRRPQLWISEQRASLMGPYPNTSCMSGRRQEMRAHTRLDGPGNFELSVRRMNFQAHSSQNRKCSHWYVRPVLVLQSL